ncbi:MAG: hypothetical protein FI718_02285 [SAR202 cluster bacterium]|nr:hypothetical protein [Chloroflexota bacterium]MQG38802.1 hypothetical protein [SAR202 cluster bacterium]|tara:strand:- start:5346 stop:5780 length:435 start_codon:yes stop_codon:yes gene_type:complete
MNKDEKNIESSREVTIIGYGESGYELVNSINNLGLKITIMDINPEVFSKLPDVNIKNGDIVPIIGDGMSINDLSNLSKDSSVVIVLTGNDSANLFIGQLAKQLFSASKIICKINNEKLRLLGDSQNIVAYSPITLFNEKILSII